MPHHARDYEEIMDRERRLFERIKAGDATARAELVELYTPLVLRMVKRKIDVLHPLKRYAEDLRQEGFCGLFTAIARFEPSRGVIFGSYALWWIQDAINQFIFKNHLSVAIPLTSSTRKAIYRLTTEKTKRNIYGEMTVEDLEAIAEHLGVRVEDIHRAEAFYRKSVPIGDIKDSVSIDIETEIVNREWFSRRAQEFIRAFRAIQASSRNKELFLVYFGVHPRICVSQGHTFTLEEIGKMFGGISKERVRQIVEGVYKKICKELGLIPVENPAFRAKKKSKAKQLPAPLACSLV